MVGIWILVEIRVFNPLFHGLDEYVLDSASRA